MIKKIKFKNMFVKNNIAEVITKFLDKHKCASARIFLFYYMLVSFTSIWLTYTDIKLIIEKLAKFQAAKDTCKLLNICGDTIITGYIKQHHFQITSFVEIGFLIIGVVVGNIGWDITGEIKRVGLSNIRKYLKIIFIIVITPMIFSITSNDYFDYMSGDYYYPISNFHHFIPILLSLFVSLICLYIDRIKNHLIG